MDVGHTGKLKLFHDATDRAGRKAALKNETTKSLKKIKRQFWSRHLLSSPYLGAWLSRSAQRCKGMQRRLYTLHSAVSGATIVTSKNKMMFSQTWKILFVLSCVVFAIDGHSHSVLKRDRAKRETFRPPWRSAPVYRCDGTPNIYILHWQTLPVPSPRKF